MAIRGLGITVVISGILGLLFSLSIPLVVSEQRALAAPFPQSSEEGQRVFQGKCAACHTIGQGDLVGPDLKDVIGQRGKDWLAQWIAAPDQMLSQQDPIAIELLAKYGIPMPNLGLADGEVASVILFLEEQGGGAPVGQGAPAPLPLSAGDPDTGKSLFMGNDRFENGGPPCLACHSVSGIGALGGGKLGPDLTTSLNKYGGTNGLAAFLGGVPTTTMNTVWGDRPLTDQERANIVAFLEEASVSERPGDKVWQLALLGLAGVVVMMVGAHMFWWRRLRKVRQPMVGS